MGVVRAALVKDGQVENVILVDPEASDYTPPDGCELVLIGDTFTDIGDFYDGGKFYRKMQLWASPNPASVGDVVTVTATLQPDTPDATVTFKADEAPLTEEPVQNGKAEAAFSFSLPGTYVITTSSPHHGSATVEVIVQ